MKTCTGIQLHPCWLSQVSLHWHWFIPAPFMPFPCRQVCWELPFSFAQQAIKTASQFVSGHHKCIICNRLDLSNKGKCWKDPLSLCNTALPHKTIAVIFLEAWVHDTWVLLCILPLGSSCGYSFHISTNVNPQEWKILRDSLLLSSWMFQK